MAGHVSVPVYPTLTADSVKAILGHSEARLVFIGKLDGYDATKDGIAEPMDRIAFPLSPPNAGNAWNDRVTSTSPMPDTPDRDLEENRLLAHPEMLQACVSGVSMAQPYAVVVLSKSAGRSTAIERDLEAIRDEVNAAVEHHERLPAIVIAKEAWTVENGLLTPTLKLKRGAIEEHYAPFVRQWRAGKREPALGPVFSEPVESCCTSFGPLANARDRFAENDARGAARVWVAPGRELWHHRHRHRRD